MRTCSTGPQSVRGCSASELCSILPRRTCLRLILFCTCPPLCAGALWTGSGVMSDLFFFFFFVDVQYVVREYSGQVASTVPLRGDGFMQAACRPRLSRG